MQKMEVILPHGPGFRLLSSVFADDDGQVISIFEYTGDETLKLADHFPGKPMLPGVLILEGMAEAMIQKGQTDPRLEGTLFVLAGIDRSRFHKPILPSMTVAYTGEIEMKNRRMGIAKVLASVDDVVMAEAELLFAIVQK